jgi:CubicO group peptidase (beta-lactamase class C family)
MKKALFLFALLPLLSLLTLQATAFAAETETLNLPRLGNIVIDGDGKDWGDRGMQVNLLKTYWGNDNPDDSYFPRYRLAWNEAGLLLFYQARDLDIREPKDVGELEGYDDLYIDARIPDNGADFHVYLSPGLNPKRDKPAVYPGSPDAAGDRKAAENIVSAAKATADGFSLEALFPWENFGFKPEVGKAFRFQVCGGNLGRQTASSWTCWYQGLDSYGVLQMRLAEKPSAPLNAIITLLKINLATQQVAAQVRTAPRFIGSTVSVKTGELKLGEGKVEAGPAGLGEAVILLPRSGPRYSYESRLDIYAGKTWLGYTVPAFNNSNLPGKSDNIPLLFPQGIETANLRFDPCVFSDGTFPPCDFERPELAEALLGHYRIDVVFYDKDYKVVEFADKPGRYGAVITVTPGNGSPPFRRFRTLFRMPEPIGYWWASDFSCQVNLSKQFGINPKVAAAEMKDISGYFRGELFDGLLSRDQNFAVLLAGLYEMPADGKTASPANDTRARDLAWWLKLRKPLAGETTPPQPLVCPRPIEGRPAPVLHAGSLAEAGMAPEGIKKLDQLLQTWAADSDEAFGVLIARHGVIALHKAYGLRNGKPITIDTESWLASITKTLSANLLWMMVDQGRLDLDTPLDQYLPQLRGIPVKRPMTLRNLYTHTAGFRYSDGWGDEGGDAVEILASYYPYLKVGERYCYSGTDMAIGGRTIEWVSGETIPEFYQKHLLGPLGCNHLEVRGTYGDAYSTPLDAAKIAQMMLNRGAYGKMRFYSEATFREMVPQPQTKVLGPDSDFKYGIGLQPMEFPGFSAATFGHGAASSSDLIVDPEKDLIVIMTRNTAGKNFDKYHPQFLKGVLASLEGTAAKP